MTTMLPRHQIFITFVLCIAFNTACWATNSVTTEAALVKKGLELQAEKARLDKVHAELTILSNKLTDLEHRTDYLSKTLHSKPSSDPDYSAMYSELKACQIVYETDRNSYEKHVTVFQRDYERWENNFRAYTREYEKWSAEETRRREEGYERFRREWAHDVISRNTGEYSLAGIPFDQLDETYEQWYAEENQPSEEYPEPSKPETIRAQWNPNVKVACKRCNQFNCKGCVCKKCRKSKCKGDCVRCEACSKYGCTCYIH